MSPSRFRYALDGLLRKRRADWKTVKMEETTIAQVVEQRVADANDAHRTVRETEQLLRQGRGDGETIDPLRQHIFASYLTEQRGVLGQRQQALKQARDVHEQIRSNLERIARGIRSLEKHRAQREADHRLLQEGIEQNRADELWLLQRRSNAQR